MVSPDFLAIILNKIQSEPKTNLIIDLENQTISIENHDLVAHFEIDPYKKICMINGFDDIDFLHNIKSEITAFAENSQY